MPSVSLPFLVDESLFAIHPIRLKYFKMFIYLLFMNRIVSTQISTVHSKFPSSIKCSATNLQTGFLEYTVYAWCPPGARPQGYNFRFRSVQVEEYISLAKPRGVLCIVSRNSAKVKIILWRCVHYIILGITLRNSKVGFAYPQAGSSSFSLLPHQRKFHAHS